jgi:DNA-binding MarR family transcriptional regulator
MISFLLALSWKEGCSQEHLARYLNLSKATATRAIAALEKGGYVYRIKDENDRRIYRVFISEKGKQTVPLIVRTLGEWNRTLLSGFSEEEEETFARLLDKARSNLLEFDSMNNGKQKNR